MPNLKISQMLAAGHRPPKAIGRYTREGPMVWTGEEPPGPFPGLIMASAPNPPRRNPMSFSLPDLPYSYDALAPYMSRETLEYHHDKHHLAYVNNGNNLLKGTEWEGKSLEDVVKGSYGKNPGLFNNAGQHYNHIHFWQWMKPSGGGDKIPGNLEKRIVSDLGSVPKMKED